MCLAVPARVLEITEDNMAVVDVGGVRRTVCLDLVTDVRVDDYVLVHVGFALQRIDQREAKRQAERLAAMFSGEPGGADAT
jgi:hydrogenase expression/formation protein HypC